VHFSYIGYVALRHKSRCFVRHLKCSRLPPTGKVAIVWQTCGVVWQSVGSCKLLIYKEFNDHTVGNTIVAETR